MMYLVSTFAAGAAAFELRNLSVTASEKKVAYNGHGLTNGQILKASADMGGDGSANNKGLNAGSMYVVSGVTTNDFQLKTFKATDATGDADITFENNTTGPAGTLTKYGSKKCKLTNSVASSNKVTCADDTHGFLKTDALEVYCTDLATANACQIDDAQEGNAGGGHLGHGDPVWALEEGAASFTIARTKPAADGTAGTAITIAENMNAATQSKAWLLSKDTSYVYPLAPKTLAADGGAWTGNTTHGAADDWAAVCGGEACKIADGVAYYYTAGSAATTGLTGGKVYYGVVAAASPWKFKLKAAAINSTSKVMSAGTAVKVTGSGNGDTYQKVTDIRQITASAKTAGTITIKGDNSGGEYAADVVMMFYCSDTETADACKYNVTGMTNGSTFKIKAKTDTGTASTAATLKAATGTDATAIAVTDDSTKSAGYAMKKSSDAAIVFPAAAAGSAARSFAMLGSAVAMATAFLLA